MITKITGQLVGLSEEAATVAVGGFEYEVLVSDLTRRQLQDKLGQQISLYTIEFLEGNPMQGRLIPRLVGFMAAAEREFFDLFCSVDGVGVRKALRAMVRPVADIATAIEEKDAKYLASLPGIGTATAERIIAKLRRRMSKFALLVTQQQASESKTKPDVVSETYEVLLSLGHTEADARRLLDAALATGKKFPDVQSLLHAVYQQVHKSRNRRH